jgi:SAM-dependent methyltransferase
MISDEPSPLFAELKRSAAGRWPTSLGDTLEIGAGTGYQTVPLIMAGEARSLVVTDVSVKMLDICRSRLVRMGLDRRQPLLFLTYGGTESPFRDASFDSCFGSSVVHHILDVGAFLADMARLLRPGGVAFFLEPNARFHRALLATLADILMDMGHDEPGNPDLPLMVNWLAEVNLNLSHMGDLEFLASREDKHLFFSEEIEGLARQQGFAVAEALPLRPDPCGCQALETYVTQCGVSPRTRTEVVARARQIGQRYFSLLPPRDLSPSFLLWFSKAAAACPPAPRLPAAEPDPLTDNLILYRVELRRDRDTCRVQGWAVGHRPPAWLLLTLNGQPARVPIWLPSVDVNQAFGWRSARLFANALCARLTAEIPIDSAGPILTAAIETADGGRLELTPAEGLALGDEAVILTNASAAVG